MARTKKAPNSGETGPNITNVGSGSGLERVVISLRNMPFSERPVIEIVAILAFGSVMAGRDALLCFGFGLTIIAIHIIWSEWKRTHNR